MFSSSSSEQFTEHWLMLYWWARLYSYISWDSVVKGKLYLFGGVSSSLAEECLQGVYCFHISKITGHWEVTSDISTITALATQPWKSHAVSPFQSLWRGSALPPRACHSELRTTARLPWETASMCSVVSCMEFPLMTSCCSTQVSVKPHVQYTDRASPFIEGDCGRHSQYPLFQFHWVGPLLRPQELCHLQGILPYALLFHLFKVLKAAPLLYFNVCLCFNSPAPPHRKCYENILLLLWYVVCMLLHAQLLQLSENTK